MNKIIFRDLEKIRYKEAWDLQEYYFKNIVDQKIQNRNTPGYEKLTKNYLLFCEHPPVYTLGKSGDINNVLLNEEQQKEKGVEFFKINRGGDITFHGPGQLVGYPVMDLENFFTDIHKYLRLLEETMILTLAEYGIVAGRYPGYTGVWLEPDDEFHARKICAIGVRCSRWITMHGWAFNINTDLSYFNHIIPCGIKDKDVTSMAKELGKPLNMAEVKAVVKHHFANLFHAELISEPAV
ncbi:MAG: lipoyl(octanoyl) transferase LipB [Bacteroidia bacterium]